MNNFKKKITNLSYLIKIEAVLNSKNSIQEANNIRYVENRGYKGKGYHWYGLGMVFLSFLLFKPYEGIWALVVFLIFGGIGLFIFIYNYISPQKLMILDRINGTITMTRPFWKKSVLIPFDQGEAVEGSYMAGHTLHTQISFHFKGKKSRGGILAEHHLKEFWNFTVWYMDKNRPLPPGTAFDPYRKKDFERRRAEGFPKPLYPSNIPTPEATKEQQAERERIGGW